MSKQSISKRERFHFTLLDNTESHIPSGNITYLIAFAIPVIMFVALYYVRSIYPFGNNCYLRSDMYHQYAPFFSELWNKLHNGEGLTYSWNVGMGTDFTSLFAYYLASPANWIIALFPQKYMIEVMNAIIILKLAASSTSICYYLSKHFHTKSTILAVFGIFYGMSGYVAAYSWNIMWLDCIVLVPLIMLGLERLVNENKCLLYCISLGLCIYTNYYISIMVCMSVILYFIVLIISYEGNRHPKIYIKKFVHWCIYSLIAGGLAACLLLPELYTFSLSASSKISFPKTLSSYFSVFQMLTRQLMNIPVHLGLEHHPNIYCGVAVFVLLPLYIMNKHIKSREKIGKVVLLLVFLLAFNLNIPNFIWHGFHYPNSLPCRQGFIYIFFLITMCYEAFHYLQYTTKGQMATSVWIAVGFLFFVEQIFTGDYKVSFTSIYLSGFFILCYALLLYAKQHLKLKVPILLFFAFAVAIVECTINMEATGIGTTNRTSYLLDYDAVKTVTDTVAESDSSFYRMDKILGARTKNDGAWHNYKTISTFSSTSNAGMSDLLGLMGFEHSMNAYGYDGSTMVTNSLFSVKYLISNKHLKESPLLTYTTGADGEFIYQNMNTLPIGYKVDSDLDKNWQPNDMYNGIENQNNLVKCLTGVNNVFSLTYNYKTVYDTTFNPVENGHVYLIMKDCDVESIGVRINDTVTNYTGLDKGNHTIDIGYVTVTDSVQVYADKSMDLMVYTMDTNKFTEAFNKLNSHALNIESYTSTKIKGTINADTDGSILFSIPYDGGWNVYIDGHKVATNAFKNALLSVPVTAGEHKVVLKYIPVNLINGCIITFLCIMILIIVCLFKKYCRLGKFDTSKLPLFIQDYICEEDIVHKGPEMVLMTQVEIDEMNQDSRTESDESNSLLNEEADHVPEHLLDSLDDFDNLDIDDSEEESDD